MKARVARIEGLTPRVKRFTLAGALPSYSGGSHIGVVLPVPGGTIRNSYSITSSPYQRDFIQIAVQLAPESKGGSVWMHEALHEGAELEITTPFNQFPLARDARRHLLIAGGIGITPFVSQIESLARWGAPFELHYIYRGENNAAFLPELQARLDSRLVRHNTPATPRPDLFALLGTQPNGTHVYVCGPAALIDAVLETATALGWPESHVHFERFGAGLLPAARPFVAKLAKSAREIHVPQDASLLEVLEHEGVSIPFSCRIGGCGTCEVPVAGGEIEHRDHCWTAEDRACGTRLLACISRAKNGHLVLDL
jgi:dimethylamine monooxygenase subunit B